MLSIMAACRRGIGNAMKEFMASLQEILEEREVDLTDNTARKRDSNTTHQ